MFLLAGLVVYFATTSMGLLSKDEKEHERNGRLPLTEPTSAPSDVGETTPVPTVAATRRTGSPTMAPTVPLSRVEQLKQMVLRSGIVNSWFLEDSSSSQFYALNWLAGEDQAQLSFEELQLEENAARLTHVLQRYILAVLYHSTGGTIQIWDNDGGWLSQKPTCLWDGIVCNNVGHVIQLELGRFLVGVGRTLNQVFGTSSTQALPEMRPARFRFLNPFSLSHPLDNYL